MRQSVPRETKPSLMWPSARPTDSAAACVSLLSRRVPTTSTGVPSSSVIVRARASIQRYVPS